jgi:MFS family permease
MPDIVILSTFLVTALSNSAYAMVAPFLPNELIAAHVASTDVGYIFSAYSLAVIICGPFIGNYIPVVGRSNFISLGMVCMGTSFCLFGFIFTTDNETLILWSSVGIRFLQGFSSCAIQTCCYSIATNLYPDIKEKFVG